MGIGFRNEVKDISTRLKHSPLKVVKETIVLFLLEVLSILIYFYELSLFFKSFFFLFFQACRKFICSEFCHTLE